MRAPLVFALAIGLAALAWLSLRGGGEEQTPEECAPPPAPPPIADPRVPVEGVRIEVGDDPPPSTTTGPGPVVPIATGPDGTAPRGTNGETVKAPPYVPPPPPDQLPRGTLAIQVRDADGNTVPADTLRVDADPIGGIHWTAPSPMREERTGVWDFGSVPIGKLRIKVWGDHVVETNKDVEVRENEKTDETVVVRYAGAIAYEVLRANGERLEQVTLSLAQGRRSVKAYWQVRLEDLLTQPRLGSQFTQGPRGIVFGIPAGKYTLTAQTSGEDAITQEVEVVAQRTGNVVLRLR